MSTCLKARCDHHMLPTVAVGRDARTFRQLGHAAILDKRQASVGKARRCHDLFVAEFRSADPWIFHASIPSENIVLDQRAVKQQNDFRTFDGTRSRFR